MIIIHSYLENLDIFRQKLYKDYDGHPIEEVIYMYVDFLSE